MRKHVMECGEDHRLGFGRWKRPLWRAAEEGGIPCRTPWRTARRTEMASPPLPGFLKTPPLCGFSKANPWENSDKNLDSGPEAAEVVACGLILSRSSRHPMMPYSPAAPLRLAAAAQAMTGAVPAAITTPSGSA